MRTKAHNIFSVLLFFGGRWGRAPPPEISLMGFLLSQMCQCYKHFQHLGDFADFALLLIDELSYFLHNSLLNYSGFL